mgnify:FL=1
MNGNGDFIISWLSNNQTDGGAKSIYAQRYASTGSTNGSEFKVNVLTNNSNDRPAIAMDTLGDFIITWQYGTSPSFDILSHRFNSGGTSL